MGHVVVAGPPPGGRRERPHDLRQPRKMPVEISFFGTACGVFAHSNAGYAFVAGSSIQQAKEAALLELRQAGPILPDRRRGLRRRRRALRGTVK